MLMNIATVIATVLGFIFPQYLLTPYAAMMRTKPIPTERRHALFFGVIVFIILLIANS